jgi:hypothetical protein
MLQRDPQRRASAAELLLHPWLREHCPHLAAEAPASQPHLQAEQLAGQ